MQPESIRCFVAVEIPESIQDLLTEIQEAFRPKIERASWTRPRNIHLTLKFIGEVENNSVNQIDASLHRTAGQQKPFSIEIGGVGAFPNLVQPRVLWVGIKRGTIQLSTLASTIDDELVKLGFSNENRFHPHLTLARLKNQVNLSTYSKLFKKFETIEGAFLTVDKITLVKSELRPSGAVYTPIQNYQLGREKVENGK